MNLLRKLPLGIITATVLIFSHRTAVAETVCNTNAINTAENIAVRLFVPSPSNPFEYIPRGSGVLLQKDENSYYVLTNYHVALNDEYSIDDERLVLTRIYPKNGESEEKNSLYKKMDIALFELKEKVPDRNVAPLASSVALKSGASICVAGFPIEENNFRAFKSTSQIITNPTTPNNGQQFLGYKPLAPKNNPVPGMSGGPIINLQNELVGIHKGENPKISIENLGVPLSNILKAFPEISQKININTSGNKPIGGTITPPKKPVLILIPVNKPFRNLFPKPVRGSF
jgi:serine protease Do